MRAIYLLSAVIFLCYLGSGATNPFQPIYAESLGASIAEVGLVAGMFSTANLVGSLFWGRLADQTGRRKPLIVGATLALALSNALMSVAGDWRVALALRTADGLALSAYGVASMAMLGDVLEGNARRGQIIGAYRMAGSLAFSVAIASAGLLVGVAGLPAAYRFAGIVYLLAFVASALVPEQRRARLAGVATVDGSLLALARGPMRPTVLVAAAFMVPFSAVYSVWPIWVSDVMGYGRTTFSQLWALAAFVEVPGMLLAGYVVSRRGWRPTFAVGLALWVCVYGVYALAASLPELVGAQLVRGFAFAACTATAMTMAIEMAPEQARARAAGVFQIALGLSQTTGGYLGGPIVALAGFRELFFVAGVAALTGAGYVATSGRRDRVEPPARPGTPGA